MARRSVVCFVPLIAAAASALAACAGPPRPPEEPNYLRSVAFRLWPDSVLLRWQEDRMPLRVYLPEPPEGPVDDPERMRSKIREAVLAWSGVAAPGIPSFEFVDDPADADIPFRWEPEPRGDWYIAHCVYQISPRQRRFGVATVLVTARYQDGHPPSPRDFYHTVMHEMGHALGLGGHSPDPADIMHARINGRQDGLSPRDRATLRMLYARPNGSPMVGARRERSW